MQTVGSHFTKLVQDESLGPKLKKNEKGGVNNQSTISFGPGNKYE